jgi:hypothetical protein
LALVLAFTAALSTPFATLDVMLIGAAVALGAVVELADAFFNVLAPDVVGRVIVAAITRGAAVVVARVASDTTRGVVLVQHKVFVVIKTGRCPLVLAMALQAVAGDLLVQGIGGYPVAGLACLTGTWLEQVMLKLALPGKALHPRVIAMASYAVLAEQLLVKCRFDWLGQFGTQTCPNADVNGLVATGAFF